MHGDIVSCRSASQAHNAISEAFHDSSPCAARHSGLIGIFPIGKPSPQTLRWFRDDFPRVQACLFTSMVYVKTRADGMNHRDSPRLARSPRGLIGLCARPFMGGLFLGEFAVRVDRSARRHVVRCTIDDQHRTLMPERVRAAHFIHPESPCRDLGIFPIFEF